MFTDRVIIELKAGKGGDGVIAWRREKYIAKGGPFGGNGGKGGSVIFVSDAEMHSLEAFRNKRILVAENGQQGGSNNRQGRNGTDLVLKVPCGTLIKNASTGEVLHDFTVDKEKWQICQGGKGGKGNSHFKSPTNQAPFQFTKGHEGEECEVELELKLIADVGLVGFPNAGKSTLISSLTDIAVKIAPYPFTTLRPNLGFIMCEYGQRILMADIPGIIAGAHLDKGLGLEFLRHIERTHILLFVVDISGIDGRDPAEDFRVLREELEAHNPELSAKTFFTVINKIDADDAEEKIQAFRKAYPFKPETLFEVSALTGQGLEALTDRLKRVLNK